MWCAHSGPGPSSWFGASAAVSKHCCCWRSRGALPPTALGPCICWHCGPPHYRVCRRCAPRAQLCARLQQSCSCPCRPDDRPTWNSHAARLTGRGDVFGAVLRCYVRLTWRCDRPSMILNRLAQAGGILVEACARPCRRLRYPTAERCNAMVTEVFDARQIPEADRLEATRAMVAQRYAPLEMEFAADLGPMAAHFLLTELGDLVLCSSVSTAVKLHRTAALARDDLTPSVFVALQMTGSSVVVQVEREVVLRPGELVVYDS